MQVTESFSRRIVVISGGGSAASALPQTPSPPRPAAPAKVALVRNRRRDWIGMEHLPDPNGRITMSLARWPIRAVRIEASAALGCPRIADHDMPVKVRG